MVPKGQYIVGLVVYIRGKPCMERQPMMFLKMVNLTLQDFMFTMGPRCKMNLFSIL